MSAAERVQKLPAQNCFIMTLMQRRQYCFPLVLLIIHISFNAGFCFVSGLIAFTSCSDANDIFHHTVLLFMHKSYQN